MGEEKQTCDVSEEEATSLLSTLSSTGASPAVSSAVLLLVPREIFLDLPPPTAELVLWEDLRVDEGEGDEDGEAEERSGESSLRR